MSRRIRIFALGTVGLFGSAFGGFAGETFTPVLSEDAKSILYSPCSTEDVSECIAYSIDCAGSDTFGNALHITIFGNEEKGPNVRTLAKALLDKPFGEAKVHLLFGKGETGDAVVTALTVSENEMDGDWLLDLYSYDNSGLMEGLTKDPASVVKLDVAGHQLTLADNAKAADMLSRFKAACSG